MTAGWIHPALLPPKREATVHRACVGKAKHVTATPLPGCCNFCHEPVTQRQKSVLFEGPNLRYPQLGEDTAVFHTRQYCLRDARGYGEAWAATVPGRVPKFPGWLAGEELLRLIEILGESDVKTDEGVPVAVHMTGGEYDGACMKASMPQAWDVYYVEPVPQPRAPRRGIWYEHSADCPCGAVGAGPIAPGDHTYRPKPASAASTLSADA